MLLHISGGLYNSILLHFFGEKIMRAKIWSKKKRKWEAHDVKNENEMDRLIKRWRGAG